MMLNVYDRTRMATRERTLIVTADGNLFPLDNYGGRALLQEAGLGHAPVRYLTQRGPYQDGETVVDFRLDTREIVLLIREERCSRAQYWEARAAIVDALRPNRSDNGSVQAPRLRRVLADGTTRDLYVFLEEGLRFEPQPQDIWDHWAYNEPLRLRAHDPVWFDPTAVEVAFELETLEELVFPIRFPIVFGTGVLNNTEAVLYAGTWPSFPIITITGPLEQPAVTNISLGTLIALDGYDVPEGEAVEIDLRYGHQTVRNLTTGSNLIGAVSEESDLATWRLECAPRVAGGVNEINVYGTGAILGQTAVALDYYTRYIGI